MISVLIICTALTLLLTLLPLSRHPHWIIRGMDFPRLQFAVVIAALLIADFLFLDMQSVLTWLLISIAALCLIWQLWWILPYTFLWPLEVKKASNSSVENQISILTANVLTPNKKAELLIQNTLPKYNKTLLRRYNTQFKNDKKLDKQLRYMNITFIIE